MQNINSIIFFNYSKNLFWAFKQMGLYRSHLKRVRGLRFYKLLGTGKKPGFRVTPDFNTYALLTSFDSKESMDKFYEDDEYLQQFKEKCNSIRFIELETISSHGFWGDIKPFTNSRKINETDFSKSKIAVLTRGAVRISKVLNFWLSIGSASKSISQAEGVSFYKGIGEFPLFEQATFSIWDNFNYIKKFAYKDKLHFDIVKKAKEEKWYKEDMFVRFLVKSDKLIEF